MIADQNLPGDWQAESTAHTYDETMDRRFESRTYEHAARDATVNINEVDEPDDLEAWGFLVVATPDRGPADELGLHDSLEAARETAIEYMEAHP